MFTVDFLGNVVGGKEVRYLNLPIDEFKKLAIAQIKDGETVWFGCDVGQISDRILGMMDLNIFMNMKNHLEMQFVDLKATHLDYCESLMTHAMVLTGVNLDENGNLIDGKLKIAGAMIMEIKDLCYD